jgi:hypothetical protein
LSNIAVLSQSENTIPSEVQSDTPEVRDSNARYVATGIYRYELILDHDKNVDFAKIGVGVYDINHLVSNLFYFYGVSAGYNFDYDMPELDTYIGFNYYLAVRIRAHFAHDMTKFNFSYIPEVGFGLDKGFLMVGYRMWVVNPNAIQNELQFHLSFTMPFSWYY